MSRAREQSPEDLIGHRFWEGVTGEHETRRSEVRYFGIVKRIPKAAFPTSRGRLDAMIMEWDESIASMKADLPATLPVSMQTWEPLPKGTVERYEAFDRDSGDLLIFWRVPCRRKG
ncbi:MAG: hypothetical protein R2909_09425 [Gemmatimonadales bacterium]